MSDSRFFGGKVVLAGSSPFTVPKATADSGSPVNGDIYYNTTTNKFRKYENGAWSDLSSGGTGSGININIFTLSGTDITNKFVTLSSVPTTPTKIQLTVIGGPLQEYSVDFTSTGTQLSWNSLSLDGILESGDKVIVQFD